MTRTGLKTSLGQINRQTACFLAEDTNVTAIVVAAAAHL
jgi:hypothetical protein